MSITIRRTGSLVESLDTRQLLAADFATLSSHGTLSIAGTAANNQIRVDLIGGQVIARRDGLIMKFDPAKVKRFWLNGFGGNDILGINIAKAATLIGGSGNDTLAGSRASDSIEGDGGDDTVISSMGPDVLNAGSGLATVDYS